MSRTIECIASGPDLARVEELLAEMASAVRTIDQTNVEVVPAQTQAGMFEALTTGAVVTNVLAPIATGLVVNALWKLFEARGAKTTPQPKSHASGPVTVNVGSVSVVVVIVEKDE